MNNLSRRNFIRTTASAATAIGLMGHGASTEAAQAQCWPVSCRDTHLKVAGAECWTAIETLGLDGVEVHVTPAMDCPALTAANKQYSLATPEAIQALKADLAIHRTRITAFMMGNQFEQRLEQELQWARKLVPAAVEIGVAAIRIDVVPHKMKLEEFLPFAIKACRALCEVAAGTQIQFGIENHGNTTNDPEFLTRLFDGVGSDRLGLTLDTANFYWFGHPLKNLYAMFERFAPKVVHTHCKSIQYPEDRKNSSRPLGWEYDKYTCPIYEGDLDFNQVARILRKANYRGDLCLEDESLGKYPTSEQTGIIQKEIAMLRAVSAKAAA